MGCDGCELWLGKDKVAAELTDHICAGHPARASAKGLPAVHKTVADVVGARTTSSIYQDRSTIADQLCAKLNLGTATRGGLVDVIRRSCKCYAGLLGTMRSCHKGHARQFDVAQEFPGRMAEAAAWGPPTAAERAPKPWLTGARRLIFISDMGDALSKGIPFKYLKREIVDVVASAPGQKHLWLWLTKRPARMAELGRWLAKQNVRWPDNLVAMTSVTSQGTAGRVDQLRKVPSKYKALSCEPLFGPLRLDLRDIDWLIVGGGSDVLAESFHVEWALDLREQCNASGTAFFLKQLGRHPFYQGNPLKLQNPHGGDWNEWTRAWQTRTTPF